MKICLIGSTRFLAGYHDLNRMLTLAGHVVYTVSLVSTQERGAYPSNLPVEDKETLDLVHLIKIQESEGVVLVTNKDGYVGDSTRRELKWASLLGKMVYRPGATIVNAFENITTINGLEVWDLDAVVAIGTYEYE